jgi:DNA-directed RNA polymerase subunit RPC12/RpoP
VSYLLKRISGKRRIKNSFYNSYRLVNFCFRFFSVFYDCRILEKLDDLSACKYIKKINKMNFRFLKLSCIIVFIYWSFRHKPELNILGERPYQCLICSKSFRARSNLDVHMKIHNGIKDYVCNVCGREFIVKNDLKRHLTLHIGSKDFVCQECGKSFNRKYQLEKHR